MPCILIEEMIQCEITESHVLNSICWYGEMLICDILSLSLHVCIYVCTYPSISVLSNIAATNYMCLLSTWNVAGLNEELNFKFYFN